MSDREWNYDRIVSVSAMINSVRCDMDITLYRGISRGMRDRMVQMLRDCADEIAKMSTNP